MVMPSSMPENFTVPATSVMIGWVCGSQLATTSPALTSALSATLMMAP